MLGLTPFPETLTKRGSSFRAPVLAVTIGVYLPFELEVPIFIGGLLSFTIKRLQTRKQLKSEVVAESNRNGLLFSSGLITGEALAGILLAIPIVATGNPDILSLFDKPTTIGLITGILLLGSVAFWLFKVVTKRAS